MSCFSKIFGSERVNEFLKVLKPAEKYFYPTFSSFIASLSYEKLVLVTCKILGLLFKTLSAKYGYSHNNTDNLQLRGQMQLSWKLKTFSAFFIAFFGCTLNFEYIEKAISTLA